MCIRDRYSKNLLSSAHFSRELRTLKTKAINKRSWNFYSNTFFKVFANSVSPHSKIWFSRFSYEHNNVIFFTPPLSSSWNWRILIFEIQSRGSQFNTIDIQLAAESIEFNQIYLFDWFLMDRINRMIIKLMEFCKVFCDLFNECLIVFRLHLIAIRLHSTAIRLHSIYENPAFVILLLAWMKNK